MWCVIFSVVLCMTVARIYLNYWVSYAFIVTVIGKLIDESLKLNILI